MALCPPAVGGALCTDADVRVRVVGMPRRDAGLEACEKVCDRGCWMSKIQKYVVIVNTIMTSEALPKKDMHHES